MTNGGNDNGGRSAERSVLGQRGESIAEQRLIEAGYTILHRGWRCRSGELDIVALQDETLVFVEVRTRTTGGKYGTAEESVDWRKQRQVRAVAAVYCQREQWLDQPVRFDVIAITIARATGEVDQYSHLCGAF
ncbi:YraN family protein [Paenibacillus sp. GCM10027626]|uniref:YraN family protein n=1 Tax=Paenibacillus sp. GCM10027626 TaxID=3273411 RepID=UPI00362CBD51